MLNRINTVIYSFLDLVIPDWDCLVGIRSRIFKVAYKAEGKLYIRKGNFINNPAKFKVGKNIVMNKENIFDNNGFITFGDDCMIGFRNTFLTVTHFEKESKDPHKKENSHFYYKPVVLGNGVWITSNCIILPGTVIEDNVILSAGSVAKGKLEAGWVYSGNPAVKIRKTTGAVR
jgi:acetyltransferase-like isoleucine patch superfamily enzyme